ncbi:hypothetical protein [Massilia sp. AB1]|uniref:hypothetical protein n=1 Tax=Massilia sp. AB1 TaxID=2823371 RepID=UPI001B82BDE9|nr:hypothetical protein [Massilia sp. AB1]MBQ5939815.1 hypothetical protein [Massilia sp. AB1]
MNARLIMTAVVGILAIHAYAQPAKTKPEAWDGRPKPLRGDYQVYGGTLSEGIPPTSKNRKVAFMFIGPLAKQLFGQIGPDTKVSCSDAEGYRERRRGDLTCTQDQDGYSCYFGLDVPTGKSTHGSIC